MGMFTDCSGECRDCLITYIGGCIAGHGDDDFIFLTAKNIKSIPNKGRRLDAIIRRKTLQEKTEFKATIKEIAEICDVSEEEQGALFDVLSKKIEDGKE